MAKTYAGVKSANPKYSGIDFSFNTKGEISGLWLHLVHDIIDANGVILKRDVLEEIDVWQKFPVADRARIQELYSLIVQQELQNFL